MRKTAPKIENDESNEALKAMTSEVKYQERRLTIMGVILVVIFVGCNSFYMIYYIMEGLDLKNNVLLWRANDLYIHSTARVFAIINSSVNVFIYGAFNKKFKDTFLSLFCKCCSIAKGNQYKTEKNNKTKSTTA